MLAAESPCNELRPRSVWCACLSGCPGAQAHLSFLDQPGPISSSLKKCDHQYSVCWCYLMLVVVLHGGLLEVAGGHASGADEPHRIQEQYPHTRTPCMPRQINGTRCFLVARAAWRQIFFSLVVRPDAPCLMDEKATCLQV